MSVKILFADDHEVIRRGIPALFEGSDVEVVGVAATGTELAKMVGQKEPDAVLLDVRLHADDGLDVLSNLRKKYPQIPVVMISTYDNPTYVARSIACGASDYLLKSSTRDEMVDAVVRAAHHETPPETSVLRQVQTTMEKRKDKGEATAKEHREMPLTNRERQVLRHIALGLSNKEIGVSLSISVETVKEHVQNILRKLNVPDRTAAAVWAVKVGLVE
jgi:DNA-binding NarL/FixJ family response regulator